MSRIIAADENGEHGLVLTRAHPTAAITLTLNGRVALTNDEALYLAHLLLRGVRDRIAPVRDHGRYLSHADLVDRGRLRAMLDALYPLIEDDDDPEERYAADG